MPDLDPEISAKITKSATTLYNLGKKDGKAEASKLGKSELAKRLSKIVQSVVSKTEGGKNKVDDATVRKACNKLGEAVIKGSVSHSDLISCATTVLCRLALMPEPEKKAKPKKA